VINFGAGSLPNRPLLVNLVDLFYGALWNILYMPFDLDLVIFVCSVFSKTQADSFLTNLQAVVFTDISIEKAVEYVDYCHSHQPPIALI